MVGARVVRRRERDFVRAGGRRERADRRAMMADLRRIGEGLHLEWEQEPAGSFESFAAGRLVALFSEAEVLSPELVAAAASAARDIAAERLRKETPR